MSSKTSPSPLQQIKQISEANTVSSALILCSDRIRLQRALEILAKNMHLFKDGKWQYTVKKIKLDNTSEQDLKKIAFGAQELSLFSAKKIYIFENTDKITAGKTEIILEILKNNSDNIFFFTGKTLNKNLKIYKHHYKNNTVVELEDFSGARFLTWTKKEIQYRQLDIKENALRLLVDLAEGSADTVVQLLDLLELYVENKLIELKDLQALFPEKVAANTYDWIDTITRKEITQAEIKMDSVLKSTTSAIPLIALLHTSYLNYFLITAMQKNGLDQTAIRKNFALQPWLFNKLWQSAGSMKSKDLKSNLSHILKADSKLKNKNLGDNIVLSELVYRLAA